MKAAGQVRANWDVVRRTVLTAGASVQGVLTGQSCDRGRQWQLVVAAAA
jgi:hypothetical protein